MNLTGSDPGFCDILESELALFGRFTMGQLYTILIATKVSLPTGFDTFGTSPFQQQKNSTKNIVDHKIIRVRAG